jgi:cytochrome c
MDTMEITKIVGAACGSLLIFLLIQFASNEIFDTHSELVAYVIDTGEGEAPAGEPEEAVDVEALVAAADASSGQGIFRRCSACHKVDGTNGAGPHLDGVFGRPKATVEGFGYSPALSGLGGEWDADSLFHFVQDPKRYAPGTTMGFAGLPKATDLANVIAYLQSVSN